MFSINRVVHFFLLIVLNLLLGEKANKLAYLTFLVGSTPYIGIFEIVTAKLRLFFPVILFKTC